MSLLTHSELEARLRDLEDRIGTEPNKVGAIADVEKSQLDVVTRLNRLEEKFKSSLSTPTLKQLLDESDKLLEDLQPASGFTYQQVLSGRSQDYPMIYRRQLVLASKDSLNRDLNALHEIFNLLHISQNKSLLPDRLTEAPILSVPSISVEEEQRLDSLRIQTTHCQLQLAELIERVDSLVSMYQKSLMMLSNRFIQLDEKLSRQGK